MNNLYSALSQFFKGLPKYLTFDYLMLGAFGILILALLISLVKTSFTYEVKLLRVVGKLNRHFLKEPYINEENLVRFNRKMKNVPRTLRYSWQEYMLNLDKVPSEYMSTLKCVDQPSRASGYKNVVSATMIHTVIIAVISFFASVLIYNNPLSQGESSLVGMAALFFDFFLIPVLVLTIGLLFVTFMKARHTSVVSDLYFSFHEFERNINKACTTLPQFIDYEILFTRREIKEGIPVLQEYLEKRALQEKMEQEEAEFNAAGYEQFDFSEIGIENSLLLDRAMLESEKYFKIKVEINNRIKAKEAEMQTYQKNHEEVTKIHEKKAQALRETIQQLTEQINNTTIKIETAYMRRKQQEEQQKLQQLEKEYELATYRFQKQQEEQQAEVAAFKAEIERRKNLTYEAMMAEGRTYAKKIYTVISNEVQEQSRPYLEQMENTKLELENTVQNLSGELEFKSQELDIATQKLEQAKSEYQVKLAGIEHINVLKDFLLSSEFKAGLLNAEVSGLATSDNAVELRETKEKVSTLSKTIAEKDEKIKMLEAEKALKEKELVVLAETITKQEETVSKLTNEINEFEKTVANLSDANTLLEKELAQSENQLKEAKPEPKPEVKKTQAQSSEKDVQVVKETKPKTTQKKPAASNKPAAKASSSKNIETAKQTKPKKVESADAPVNEIDELKELKAKIESESKNLEKQQVELRDSINQTIKGLNEAREQENLKAAKNPKLNKIGSALNELLEVVETMENKTKTSSAKKATAVKADDKQADAADAKTPKTKTQNTAVDKTESDK